MKRQYLGDAKDAFKWDFHDFLTTALGYPRLDVVLMCTPDDDSGHGRTDPRGFPARAAVIELCLHLRRRRRFEDAAALPEVTDGGYRLRLHGAETWFTGRERPTYFTDAARPGQRQVILLDPDNGFEPERSCDARHVGYADVRALLAAAHPQTVVSVFQHHRRRRFDGDFARIRERLGAGLHTAAIHGSALMFVAVSRSAEVMGWVREILHRYARGRPLRVLEPRTASVDWRLHPLEK